MTTWTEMTPAEFDAHLTAGRKARQVIATAPGTLFPRLMPEPSPRKPAAGRDPMPGEVPLFDLGET